MPHVLRVRLALTAVCAIAALGALPLPTAGAAPVKARAQLPDSPTSTPTFGAGRKAP